MKCLVTKLGVSVDNDNLEILGAITLRVKATTNLLLRLQYAEDVSIECIGEDITFDDGSKTKTITKRTSFDLTTNGVAGIVTIPKYSPITYLKIRSANNVVFDLKSLEYQDKSIVSFASVAEENDTIKGDLKYLINALSDSMLSTVGDSSINFNNYHGVYGTLEDILVSILDRGISNTDLQIRTVNSGITLNDAVPGTCYCVLDADAGTINIYSNSAHSTLIASYANGNWSY